MVWFEKPKVVPDVSSVHLFGGARCGSPVRLANLSKDQFPPPLKSAALPESPPQGEVFSRIPQATSPPGPFSPSQNRPVPVPRPLPGATGLPRGSSASTASEGGFLSSIILWSKGCIRYFFLMQRLRKSGKQNILIIIQASGLHKRFHSPLHQTLTVQTTNSVFAAIKHSGGKKKKKKKKI